MRMSMAIPKPQPLFHIPTGCGLDMQLPVFHHSRPQPEKLVVILGATGTGKSRLSIDLATRFTSEVVNSDKMQVYKGLDIVTNKITDEERKGVPHHLLGTIDPDSDFTAKKFCNMATMATKSIAERGKLPIIVGGSNSFIEALIDDPYCKFGSRFQCCFLWVDVAMPVLHSFVSERVDRMVDLGMVKEVEEFFNPKYCDYSRGIRKSIGVPEFDRFFRVGSFCDEETRARLLEEAIKETKNNTFKLACCQRDKIIRLRTVKGWKIHRLNATEVFRKRGDKEADKAWENLVVGPSTAIVNQFLHNNHGSNKLINYQDAMAIRASSRAASMGTAVATATH